MLSLIPASVVGSGSPPLRLPSEVAKLEPNTEIIAPGAMSPPDAKLAPLTTPPTPMIGTPAGAAATCPFSVNTPADVHELQYVTLILTGPAFEGFHIPA